MRKLWIKVRLWKCTMRCVLLLTILSYSFINGCGASSASSSSALIAASISGVAAAGKSLEIEQRLQEAPNQCSSLNITNLSLPSITEGQDPNIGTIPQVYDEAPRVIGGQLISNTQ